MSDFVTIELAKQQKKGNIMFKVISLGELKSGTTKKEEPYQKQDAVIKDSSGAMNLTLWNKDIGLLEPAGYYSLENAWWSEYKGEIQLSLGNYYNLEKISESEFVNSSSNPQQPTIEQSSTSEPTPQPQPEKSSGQEHFEAIMDDLEKIKNMVEPMFKKMVQDQLEDSKK